DLRAAVSALDEAMLERAPRAASPIEALAEAGVKEKRHLTIEAGQVDEVRHGITSFPAGRITPVDVPMLPISVLLEHFVGGKQLGAALTSIEIEEGAQLARIVVQRDGAKALSTSELRDVLLSEVRVTLAPGASFRQFVLAEGAMLARLETHVSIEGEG